MNEGGKSSGLNLSAINGEQFVLSYLASCKKPRSLTQMEYVLGRYASRWLIKDGVDSLLEKRHAELIGNGINLTEQGYRESQKQFGRNINRDHLVRIVWPSLALGIDPKSTIARELKKPGKLLSIILLKIANLPSNQGSLSLTVAATELAKSELLKYSCKDASDRDVEKIDREGMPLRREQIHTFLTRIALLKTEADCFSEIANPHLRSATNYEDFSNRVKDVVEVIASDDALEAVPISEIYDAYQKEYEDAGTLASFKKRLLKAHAAHAIQLKEAICSRQTGKQTLERSEITGPRGTFHLVIRNT